MKDKKDYMKIIGGLEAKIEEQDEYIRVMRKVQEGEKEENTCEWKRCTYGKKIKCVGIYFNSDITNWKYCPRCGRRMKRKEGYHSCPYPDGSKQESEVAYCGDVITDCSECEHNDDCGCDHDIEGCDHIRNLKVEEK